MIKRRITAILLTASLALLLFSCNDAPIQENSDNTSDSNTVTQENVPDTNEQPVKEPSDKEVSLPATTPDEGDKKGEEETEVPDNPKKPEPEKPSDETDVTNPEDTPSELPQETPEDKPENKPEDTPPAVPPADIPEEKPQNTPSETPETKPEVKVNINPLTGLETEKDLSKKRPVALMINNLKQALPQIGISEADIIYETLEEGGITRLLCIYNDYSDIPEIGSIRSTRDYYIDISDAHDAILVHAGGSTYAYTAISNRNTAHLDGLYLSQFHRSAQRLKTMSREHTLMISGEGIDSAISYKGYRTTSERPSPLVFSKDYKKSEKTGNHISIPFSVGYTAYPYITSYFDYGSTSKLYHKGHFGMPHVDGDDGEQLTFKNVITLTCPMNVIRGDALGCIQVHFTGTGKGTYSVEGTTREIVWSKPSRTGSYTLYESDGVTPLVLAPGKSYIAIVSPNTKVSIY